MRALAGLTFLLVLHLCAPVGLLAKVFYAKEEALRAAFPEADVIDRQTFFLTDDQQKQVEAIARTRLDSKLVTTVHRKTRPEAARLCYDRRAHRPHPPRGRHGCALPGRAGGLHTHPGLL